VSTLQPQRFYDAHHSCEGVDGEGGSLAELRKRSLFIVRLRWHSSAGDEDFFGSEAVRIA
jgi:hypothetical protein